VRSYLREQEAERQRQAPRYCSFCQVSPARQHGIYCSDACMERDTDAITEELIRHRVATPAFDWEVEQARLSAANARAEVILVGPREQQREVLR
jgi:hypothetical protein